jgi:hypothetical protein
LPISYAFILFEGDLKYESPRIAVFSCIISFPLSYFSQGKNEEVKGN